MKRLLSFILIIILCPQIALASQVENFRLLVNNYHYATTVEWDQKDKTFLIHENEKFHTAFSEMRANGLSNEEIHQVIPADWNMLERELLKINLQSSEAIQNLALKSVNRTQGASWNGEIIAPLAIGGAFALLIGYFVIVAVKTNRAFDACVEANGGNEAACIDR
jgi:hypothetical protein